MYSGTKSSSISSPPTFCFWLIKNRILCFCCSSNSSWESWDSNTSNEVVRLENTHIYFSQDVAKTWNFLLIFAYSFFCLGEGVSTLELLPATFPAGDGKVKLNLFFDIIYYSQKNRVLNFRLNIKPYIIYLYYTLKNEIYTGCILFQTFTI